MKKIIDYIATILIIILGTLHTALTPVLAEKFNSNPLDFAAIGMVFMLVGFFNLARLKTNANIIFILCIIANLLGIAWLCLGFIYSYIHEESFAQGIVPMVCLCIVFLQSIFDMRKLRSTIERT